MSSTLSIDTNQLAFELRREGVRSIELSVVGREDGWFIDEGVIQTENQMRFGTLLTARRSPKRYANLESIYRDVKRVSQMPALSIVLRIHEAPREGSAA